MNCPWLCFTGTVEWWWAIPTTHHCCPRGGQTWGSPHSLLIFAGISQSGQSWEVGCGQTLWVSPWTARGEQERTEGSNNLWGALSPRVPKRFMVGLDGGIQIRVPPPAALSTVSGTGTSVHWVTVILELSWMLSGSGPLLPCRAGLQGAFQHPSHLPLCTHTPSLPHTPTVM